MYVIREIPRQSRLRIKFSGRVATNEALRAIRQASVLLRTDALDGVLCDVTDVQRGPGKLLIVSAFLASEFPVGARLAFVTSEQQSAMARRITRFSGLSSQTRIFANESEANDWIEQREPALHVISPEERHLEFFVAELVRARGGRSLEKVGPAA